MRAMAIRTLALGCAGIVAALWPAGHAVLAQDQPMPRLQGYAELESLPDWAGVWSPDWAYLFGTEGRTPAKPVLTPSAQARLDAFRKREAVEGVDQLKAAQCVPPGMPGIMRMPYPIEFVMSPGRVTIFIETYSQARRIYTDGRPLPEDPDFLFNGTSSGRWEGDTLIVDTVGFSPLTDIDRGIGHSEQMRMTERIWLAEPDVLRIEATITDPEVLAQPLVQQLAFVRKRDWEMREYVCAENNRLTSEEGGANIDLGLDDEGDPFGPPPAE